MRLAVDAELLGQEQDHGALGALAVLVDARLEQDRAVELDADHGGAEIRALGAEADAAVAHGQADAVVIVLAPAAGGAPQLLLVAARGQHALEDLGHADGVAVENLAGDGRAPLADHVAPAEFDAGEARLLGRHLDELLDGEVHLRRAEAAHGAGEDVVGIDARHFAVDVGHDVGAAALHGRAPGHPGRDRAVGAAVGDDAAVARRGSARRRRRPCGSAGGRDAACSSRASTTRGRRSS